jgi:hypothetical protein
MKDNEMRELFASLANRVEAIIASAEQAIIERITGAKWEGDAAAKPDANFLTEQDRKDVLERLTRIQELTEMGRRFGAPVPPPLELPSPRVPLFVGMLIGALIFAAGMFAGTFLK